MNLPFPERYRQARLYAAQVRQRQAMGRRYDHHPNNIIKPNIRRIVSASTDIEPSVARA
jgi:hypothetical protein